MTISTPIQHWNTTSGGSCSARSVVDTAQRESNPRALPVRSEEIYGCEAVDLSCNAHRVERTQRDFRLDSNGWCLRCFSTGTIAAFARRILFVMPRLARANTTVATNDVTLFALSVPSRDRRLFAPPFHDQKFALVASAPTKCQPPLRKVQPLCRTRLCGAWQATIS